MPRDTYRKVITSEEKIEAINPKNKKLVDRFLKNFDTRRSNSSVVVYRSNFNIFFCWNLDFNDNKFFTEIKKIEFMDFFDYAVDELQWSPNRYSQMWSSLSSLSTFIENILDDDYPDFRNQIKKIEKLPKSNVRKKTVLSEEQVFNLLDFLSSTNRKQEACLLALGISSGARISELISFKTDLIDLENTAYEGLFIETTEQIRTKGRGKQGKLMYKYILKNTFEKYYLDWMEERKRIMLENNQKHDSLFIRDDGTPAMESTARSWMKKWERYLTNEEPTNVDHKEIHFYPHAMRHWLCTHLSKIGLEQELIVELFGWSSSDMFNIYNDMTAKDKKWKGLEKLKDSIGD